MRRRYRETVLGKKTDPRFLTRDWRGNSCWEFRKLLPEGNESNVTQRFNINCAQRIRSQEDIDRLARKYGIP